MFQARLARMAVEESESAALRHETQVQCPTKKVTHSAIVCHSYLMSPQHISTWDGKKMGIV